MRFALLLLLLTAPQRVGTWTVDFTIDPMTDERRCSAFSGEGGFAVGISMNSAGLVLGGFGFPKDVMVERDLLKRTAEVTYRINTDDAVTETWNTAAPNVLVLENPQAFIDKLRGATRVVVRVVESDRTSKTHVFELEKSDEAVAAFERCVAGES